MEPEPPKFVCEICGQEFDSQGRLNLHGHNVHRKQTRATRKQNMTIAFGPGDLDQIDLICSILGVSKMEAVRTSVRFYAAALDRISK